MDLYKNKNKKKIKKKAYRPTHFYYKKKKGLPTDPPLIFWVGKQQTNNFLRMALSSFIMV